MYSDEFDSAMTKMLIWEGKEIHSDPDDPGGLTCCGISKVSNSDWRGWSLIDTSRIDDKNYVKELLRDDSELMVAVYEVYNEKYWTKYNLDNYPYEISFMLFNITVNAGARTMTTILQRTLNALNYQYYFGKDLVVDGLWGPATRKMLVSCIHTGRTPHVEAGLRCLLGNHYITLTEKNPAMRKYLAGWMRRTYE